MKEKIILVHDGRPHFETVLALTSNLRECYDIFLWSNSLSYFDRASIIDLLKIEKFSQYVQYNLAIIITGDSGLINSGIDKEVLSKIEDCPTIKIMHRYNNTQNNNEIFLFPRSLRPFVPVSTGLENYLQMPDSYPDKKVFLIQGNVENRRNYEIVERAVNLIDSVYFSIIGIKVGIDIIKHKNIKTDFNLNEYMFHQACAQSHFILPMIDPIRYSGYFMDRFTSSVQIGFAYSIPFIAHLALFQLYPIVGLSYESDNDLLNCIEKAVAMPWSVYEPLRQDMQTKKDIIFQDNIRCFKETVSKLL